jgi:hypothetical protein
MLHSLTHHTPTRLAVYRAPSSSPTAKQGGEQRGSCRKDTTHPEQLLHVDTEAMMMTHC